MMQAALDFTVATVRADQGIERAVKRTEKIRPEWCAEAARMLGMGACLLELEKCDKFTIERLRARVAGAVATPADGRSWGGATRAAMRAGYIERVEGEFARAASSNNSPKQIYRKGPQA